MKPTVWDACLLYRAIGLECGDEKECKIWTFFSSSLLEVLFFVGTTTYNTINAFEERLSKSVHSYPRFYDSRLSNPPFKWAFGTAINTFAFRRVKMCSFSFQAYPDLDDSIWVWSRYCIPQCRKCFSRLLPSHLSHQGSVLKQWLPNIGLTCNIFVDSSGQTRAHCVTCVLYLHLV